MKIAIIGAGAIGSVAAAYLHKAGEDVTLIGKPQQVRAVNLHGLKIAGVRGEEVFRLPAKIVMDEACDLAIFTTKTQDLESAYQDNHEWLEDCFVLTTQNGVQADNILSCHFDKEKMFSSIVMYGATYINPGEVVFNFEGDWILGAPFAPIGPHAQRLAEILRKGFPVVTTPEIMGMKYLKLFVNFNNCIPALIGKPMQETFADSDLCRLSIRLLKEGVDIVRKAGIELVSMPAFPVERISAMAQMPEEQGAAIIQKALTNLSKEPLYGSILQSINRGKESEIDFINGEVVSLAKQMRQEAPLNERVVDLVHQVERSKKFFSIEEIKEKFNLINV
jgi:2-dehydropantoate 2-reductase